MVSRGLTPEQMDFVKRRYQSLSWGELAAQFNYTFKDSKSPDALRLLYSRYKDKDPTGKDFNDFKRASFTKQELHKKAYQRFFVSGLMPMHVIDGKLVGGVNQRALGTALGGYAEPRFLPMMGHMKLGQKQPGHYDPIMTIHRDKIVPEIHFNRNLVAVDRKINPQQLQPLVRESTFAREKNAIIAHPRQHKEFYPVGNNRHPHSAETTGVINYPGYQDNNIGRMAAAAHVMGGIVVEVEGEFFYSRKVRFDSKGGFYDLDRYVLGNNVEQGHRVEALIFGDLHIGHHREDLLAIAFEMIRVLRPKRIFFHDAFDGLSVNPHAGLFEFQGMTYAQRSLILEAEMAGRVMDRFKEAAPADCELIWVDSNHNNFLERWLKSGKYMQDKDNFEIAHRLMVAHLDGKNPLEVLMNRNYIRYLGPNDDYFVCGWQCANHGHMGINGTKGSRASVRKTASKLITGHTHVDFTAEGHEGVGKWCEDDHGYNKGAKTWVTSAAIIQPDGSVQKVTPMQTPKGLRWRGALGLQSA